jgi:hypothetical protein
MAQTMNKEARRTTVRTYEGVQWFHHGGNLWVAAVPGTNLAVQRFKRDHLPSGHKYTAFVTVAQEGVHWMEWPLATDLHLPWVHGTGSVKTISRKVRMLRQLMDSRNSRKVV